MRKKEQIDIEKVIFASVLVAIGFFVISLFSFTMIRFQMTGQPDNQPLLTQLVDDGSASPAPSTTSSSNDPAQMMIIIGALAFSLLGGVVFLGLKVQDKYM